MKKLFLSVLMCLMALSMNAQKCAVLEFRGSASVSVADIDGISEMFMTYFRPSGYTMVERAQIDKVISEQHFQRSNITDNQAVQLGKILNASVVVVGKVSMLGGQYQVDVRAVDVQSGHDLAFEGATFSGDYRTNVKNIATKLAGKLAITSGGTANSSSSQQKSTVSRLRTKVEVLYGYLKIFPTELGTFEAVPYSVIEQINKQAQHGYNNWRVPTNEEISLLRANNYLGSGQYMTEECPTGVVLLVTDGDDYATIQKVEAARKAEQARIAEETRIAEEARRASLKAQGYVDLGLPSGTLWKDKNEEGVYHSYDQAVAKFGKSLPTSTQLEELKNSCRWIWIGDGYRVEGPSGESITLPAAGYRRCDGNVITEVGTYGYYWSSTLNSSKYAWYLAFGGSNRPLINSFSEYNRCLGLSVRLVR